jgi:thioredoxin-related protein
VVAPNSGSNPADTLIPIQWVGTNVVYDSTIAKKDYSIIFFYTTSCGYCRQMESVTFGNPRVTNIIYKSFNMARINCYSDTLVNYYDTSMTCHDLAHTYNITGVPTSCVFGKKGNYIMPIVGYIDPEKFAIILEYISAGAYGE